MTIKDIAVTYDICEREGLKEEMNTYHLNPNIPLKKQLRIFARKDVAPLVVVVMWEDGKKVKIEHTFPEYDCQCDERG